MDSLISFLSAETLVTRTTPKNMPMDPEYMAGEWVHETQDSPQPFTPRIVVPHSTLPSNKSLSDSTMTQCVKSLKV